MGLTRPGLLWSVQLGSSLSSQPWTQDATPESSKVFALARYIMYSLCGDKVLLSGSNTRWGRPVSAMRDLRHPSLFEDAVHDNCMLTSCWRRSDQC